MPVGLSGVSSSSALIGSPGLGELGEAARINRRKQRESRAETLALPKLLLEGSASQTDYTTTPDPDEGSPSELSASDAGDASKMRMVGVTVHRACGLPLHLDMSSDATALKYAEVTILGRRKRTRSVPAAEHMDSDGGTASPVWEERFEFAVSPDKLGDSSFCIKIYHEHFMKSNKLVCQADLPLNTLLPGGPWWCFLHRQTAESPRRTAARTVLRISFDWAPDPPRQLVGVPDAEEEEEEKEEDEAHPLERESPEESKAYAWAKQWADGVLSAANAAAGGGGVRGYPSVGMPQLWMPHHMPMHLPMHMHPHVAMPHAWWGAPPPPFYPPYPPHPWPVPGGASPGVEPPPPPPATHACNPTSAVIQHATARLSPGSQSQRKRQFRSAWPLQAGACQITQLQVDTAASSNVPPPQVGQGLFAATPSREHERKPLCPTRRRAADAAATKVGPVQAHAPLTMNAPADGGRTAKLERIAEKAGKLQSFFSGDLDLSGTLDFHEFRRLETKRSDGARREAELRAKFDELDVNGDGRIDMQEYVQNATTGQIRYT
jgi:hypothetical protein